MTDASGDPDITELVAELTQALEDLESELEPERRLRPPTPRELTRFTSDVAIPGLILVLQTNIRALQLLKRTLQMADGRYDPGRSGRVENARERAEQLGEATLAGLDDALDDIQTALEARPEDDETREALERVRTLNEEVSEELDGTGDDTAVDIDVDQELQALKDDVEPEDSDEGDDE